MLAETELTPTAMQCHAMHGQAALVDAKRWQTMYEREYSKVIKVGIVAINSIPKDSE